MELLKLIKNRISTEWKKKFNDNVDILNGITRDQNQKIETTNKRLDNLVLHSGGDSPNEVVDARVNNRAQQFDTLQGRLLASECTHDSDMAETRTELEDQNVSIGEINKKLDKILGEYEGTLTIYVSTERGDNSTADGTQALPFKTIQAAVNTIPLLTPSQVTILIEDGTYLEDVRFRNIYSGGIYIRSVQDTTNLDPSSTDCPVRVRSISFVYCTGYLQVRGIQFVDQGNAPSTGSTRYSLYQEQGGYMSLAKCKFAENTKSISNHKTIYVGGSSKATIGSDTTFINQLMCVYVLGMAEANISGIKGSSNTEFLVVWNGTGRIPSDLNIATTNTRTIERGLILTKGSVM
ncbi:hypothetical protein NNG37_09845 [Enterococcus faecium]|nr:hypothetical protein [Enterococcus faecium]